MRTKEALEKMPQKNRDYLENLKEHIKRAEVSRQFNLADEFRSVGKGYIKGMVDCGAIEDFKPIWCWFTL